MLLDTSVAVDLINHVESTSRRASIAGQLSLSVVSRVELEAGVYRAGKLDRILRARVDALLERVDILPFTDAEAQTYAQILALCGFSRRLVIDRMIAATALRHGLTLATLNVRDFRAIAGLAVEDWSSPD